jgi:hypothetical protein
MACYLQHKGDVINREIIMTTGKLLSAAIAIAALTATPALAAHRAKQSHAHRASHSYAAEQQPNAANEIYGWDGHLIGTDPDPNIRIQMLRDQSEGGD